MGQLSPMMQKYLETKEQYKDCESYNNNGKEQIEQSVCESIILNDYL